MYSDNEKIEIGCRVRAMFRNFSRSRERKLLEKTNTLFTFGNSARIIRSTCTNEKKTFFKNIIYFVCTVIHSIY